MNYNFFGDYRDAQNHLLSEIGYCTDIYKVYLRYSKGYYNCHYVRTTFYRFRLIKIAHDHENFPYVVSYFHDSDNCHFLYTDFICIEVHHVTNSYYGAIFYRIYCSHVNSWSQ